MVPSGGDIYYSGRCLVKLPPFFVTTFTRKTSGIGGASVA